MRLLAASQDLTAQPGAFCAARRYGLLPPVGWRWRRSWLGSVLAQVLSVHHVREGQVGRIDSDSYLFCRFADHRQVRWLSRLDGQGARVRRFPDVPATGTRAVAERGEPLRPGCRSAHWSLWGEWSV